MCIQLPKTQRNMKKYLLILMFSTFINLLLGSCSKAEDIINQENENNPPKGQLDQELIGVWKKSSLEKNTSGGFTGGYLWKEYRFKADGTYQFLIKNFSIFSKNISFLFESGTWSVKDGQLTVKPIKGQDQEWSKGSGGLTSQWGAIVKNVSRKKETITYTYDWKYWEGTNTTDLQLHFSKETVRDGTFSDATSQVWYYQSFSNEYPAYMTLPPGFKW